MGVIGHHTFGNHLSPIQESVYVNELISSQKPCNYCFMWKEIIVLPKSSPKQSESQNCRVLGRVTLFILSFFYTMNTLQNAYPEYEPSAADWASFHFMVLISNFLSISTISYSDNRNPLFNSFIYKLLYEVMAISSGRSFPFLILFRTSSFMFSITIFTNLSSSSKSRLALIIGLSHYEIYWQ